MLSGLVLGFFGPFIILSIPVVIVINVLVFAIRRTMPGIAFPICLLIGALLGFVTFLFWFGAKMSHMGALG